MHACMNVLFCFKFRYKNAAAAAVARRQECNALLRKSILFLSVCSHLIMRFLLLFSYQGTATSEFVLEEHVSVIICLNIPVLRSVKYVLYSLHEECRPSCAYVEDRRCYLKTSTVRTYKSLCLKIFVKLP